MSVTDMVRGEVRFVNSDEQEKIISRLETAALSKTEILTPHVFNNQKLWKLIIYRVNYDNGKFDNVGLQEYIRLEGLIVRGRGIEDYR